MLTIICLSHTHWRGPVASFPFTKMRLIATGASAPISAEAEIDGRELRKTSLQIADGGRSQPLLCVVLGSFGPHKRQSL